MITYITCDARAELSHKSSAPSLWVDREQEITLWPACHTLVCFSAHKYTLEGWTVSGAEQSWSAERCRCSLGRYLGLRRKMKVVLVSVRENTPRDGDNLDWIKLWQLQLLELLRHTKDTEADGVVYNSTILQFHSADAFIQSDAHLRVESTTARI